MPLHLQNGEGFVPESSLRWLYDHRDNPVPPPGSRVWLACLDTNTTASHSTTLWLGNKIEDPEAYVTTFAIGHLVVQVFGQDFRGEPDAGRPGALDAGRPGALDAGHVLRRFQAALTAAGLPRQPFHALRHAYATLLPEQGQELGVVSRILGRSNIATTSDVYAHFTRTLSARAADRMDAVLDPKGSARNG
jgi:hypothetical protein